MNLKLVVTDMDGTFLNNEGTFDRESFHLLKNQMTEKDIKFVFVRENSVKGLKH